MSRESNFKRDPQTSDNEGARPIARHITFAWESNQEGELRCDGRAALRIGIG